MEQILIVEDDKALSQGLCKALQDQRRQVIACPGLSCARAQLLCGLPSLILLDINLPDGSGLELLREVKAQAPGLPVILLTAKDTDMDVVEGLDQGADDYITKPFSLSVLRARVNARLRGAGYGKAAVLELGRFRFDFTNMVFYAGEAQVELSKTEQKLLRLLAENRGAAGEDQPGVGIGLYLARRILQDQGGYIKVASTPGNGSVFSVFLPKP